MREETRLVFWLLAAMCGIQFALAVFGYAAPEALMNSLGAPVEANPQMPYIVRVWVVRDVALVLLVVLSASQSLRPLLYACVAIDVTDVVSALLSGSAGQLDQSQTLGLISTAIAALIPECIALALLARGKRLVAAGGSDSRA